MNAIGRLCFWAAAIAAYIGANLWRGWYVARRQDCQDYLSWEKYLQEMRR